MALSQIEESYLTRLTNLEFPDALVTESVQAEADMMLAAGPSKTVSDAGNGIGEIKAIPRNRAQEALGFVGELLTKAGVALDQYGVDIPGLGKVTLKDLTVGDAGKVLEDMSFGFYPVRGGNAATGGVGTFGLKPDASMELMNVAPAAGAAVKAGAKGAVKVGRMAAWEIDKAMLDGAGPMAKLIPQAAKPMNVVEPGKTLPKVVTQDQTTTSNFKNWFGDWQNSPSQSSKVVDEKGVPMAVFHGTARPDRVGNNFKKSRATSGPMSFFTDDPSIASNYAKGKQDTSLAYEETDYANWFKKKDGRSTINLDQAGARMSMQERQSVIERLRDINITDDGDIVYQPGGGTIMSNDSFDFYLKREAQGNPLKLAKQLWLESGTLYDQEEKFAKVLQLAGVKGFEADFPHSTYPAVYKVFLDIKNPFDTSTITPEFVSELESAASKMRKSPSRGGADAWDKNTISPKEWVARLRDDINNGTTHAWTSIPDWVTERLKAKGFDGIKDVGGKNGGISHTVWIPFEETQVKSAMGNNGKFDPAKKNILHGAGGATAAGAATQDKEQK